MLRRKRLGVVSCPRPMCSLTGVYFGGHRDQPLLSIRTYTTTMFGHSPEKIMNADGVMVMDNSKRLRAFASQAR